MAALDTNVVGKDGLQFDGLYVSADAAGDDCDTGPGVDLMVNNSDTASHTVTLVTPRTIDGLDVADRDIPVPDGADVAIPVGHEYRDRSTGRASITYDDVTGMTVLVKRTQAS